MLAQVMPKSHLVAVLAHSRKNAKTRGIRHDLGKPDLEELWLRSKGRCELTGIRLDLFRASAWRRRPYAPSIDRIDSNMGYTKDNCRIVCVAINLALNEWGEEVFHRISTSYLRHLRKAND